MQTGEKLREKGTSPCRCVLKRKTTKHSVYECSVRACMHTCVFVCVCRATGRECCSDWKYTHSSFKPASSSNKTTMSMQSRSQSTSQPLWSEQKPLQESVLEFLLPSHLCLQRRPIFCSSSFPSTGRNLQHCTCHLSLVSHLGFLCALGEIWTWTSLSSHGLFYLDVKAQA